MTHLWPLGSKKASLQLMFTHCTPQLSAESSCQRSTVQWSPYLKPCRSPDMIVFWFR